MGKRIVEKGRKKRKKKTQEKRPVRQSRRVKSSSRVHSTPLDKHCVGLSRTLSAVVYKNESIALI